MAGIQPDQSFSVCQRYILTNLLLPFLTTGQSIPMCLFLLCPFLAPKHLDPLLIISIFLPCLFLSILLFFFKDYLLSTHSGLGITYNFVGTGNWFVKLYPDVLPQLETPILNTLVQSTLLFENLIVHFCLASSSLDIHI